jgi:hypothetical protein
MQHHRQLFTAIRTGPAVVMLAVVFLSERQRKLKLRLRSGLKLVDVKRIIRQEVVTPALRKTGLARDFGCAVTIEIAKIP